MDRTVITLVEHWARENVPMEWQYNSRMTYWESALAAGVITQLQLDAAKRHYGSLWNYVGD